MKKLLLPLILITLLCCCKSRQKSSGIEDKNQVKIEQPEITGPDLSPATKMFISRLNALSYQPDSALVARYNLKEINGTYHIGALLIMREGAEDTELTNNHILIGSKIGNTWTVKIPVQAFRNISQWLSVQYVKVEEGLKSRK